MKNRDRAYWFDVVNADYIKGGFGKYADAIERVAKDYPEFREFCDEAAQDRAKAQIKQEIVGRLSARYNELDHKEQEKPATPPHLRQQFLPLHIDVPPLSPSISAFDGQGRLSMSDATTRQHTRHHRQILTFHTRGARYRKECVQGWEVFADEVKSRLPMIDAPDNLPLHEVIERLTQIMNDQEREAGNAQDDPPPPAV